MASVWLLLGWVRVAFGCQPVSRELLASCFLLITIPGQRTLVLFIKFLFTHISGVSELHLCPPAYQLLPLIWCHLQTWRGCNEIIHSVIWVVDSIGEEYWSLVRASIEAWRTPLSWLLDRHWNGSLNLMMALWTLWSLFSPYLVVCPCNPYLLSLAKRTL